MTQQVGETRDAICEDLSRTIQNIVNNNNNNKNKYWIVIYAKPSKTLVNGKYALMQHIKAYSNKPKSQVGMIIAEVDNQTGKITWEVNMPQKPFDFGLLKIYGAKETDEVVVETTTISNAYVCQ